MNTSGLYPVLAGESPIMQDAGSATYCAPGPTLAAEERASEDTATDCEAAFADLVKRQSRFVFRVAYAVLRNAHDAEDVAQETFWKIYRARRWNGMINERAFLARTAWRLAIGRVNANQDTGSFDTPAHGPNPEQAVLAAEWNSTVHRLMDALPLELRQPLALSSIEELNSHEIAEAMGIPEGTVRTRLMRARQTLRQKLAALMEGPDEKH